MSEQSYNIVTSSSNITYSDIAIITPTAHNPMYCLYHITGTITRDITDNAVFYYFANTWIRSDQVTIIPVKPYQSEINIDIVNITDKDTTAYNYFRVWIYTCDKDFNLIPTKSSISITVDYYCM